MLNTLGLELEEFWDMFEGFSPRNLLISRIDSTIKYDTSALEQVSLAILSDK